jgi:hypothetical protein
LALSLLAGCAATSKVEQTSGDRPSPPKAAAANPWPDNAEWRRVHDVVERSGFWRGARFKSEEALDGFTVTVQGAQVGDFRSTSAPNPLPGPLRTLADELFAFASTKKAP